MWLPITANPIPGCLRYEPSAPANQRRLGWPVFRNLSLQIGTRDCPETQPNCGHCNPSLIALQQNSTQNLDSDTDGIESFGSAPAIESPLFAPALAVDTIPAGQETSAVPPSSLVREVEALIRNEVSPTLPYLGAPGGPPTLNPSQLFGYPIWQTQTGHNPQDPSLTPEVQSLAGSAPPTQPTATTEVATPGMPPSARRMIPLSSEASPSRPVSRSSRERPDDGPRSLSRPPRHTIKPAVANGNPASSTALVSQEEFATLQVSGPTPTPKPAGSQSPMHQTLPALQDACEPEVETLNSSVTPLMAGGSTVPALMAVEVKDDPVNLVASVPVIVAVGYVADMDTSHSLLGKRRDREEEKERRTRKG